MTTLEARALSALESYLDLAPRERAKALALLRASDPELHVHVVRLLEADAMQGVLARSPQEILSGAQVPAEEEADTADPRIGTVLGPWRIEALIGSGGMGKVYRASRADGQYSQVVAIKCVGTGVDSPALAEAIRNERDTLAVLEHPNISTLLDGGIDDSGRPWFAMQLVQGEPIDRWCDSRRLGIRERIALLLRLCDGLAYAHGKAALHSDIKPSNILVDDAGRPVLLDFGLSSMAIPGWTASGRQVAMTPDYTAPEIATDGYSVRTDIYALGVVLYGLLCGDTPHQYLPMGSEPAAPPPPSVEARRGTVQMAAARGLASPAALARVLAGDLDAIAMACIARDPARRYASVERLQADLRAWLEGRPVSVRAGSAGYRMRTFLRRNRLAVAAVACGVLVLCLGLGWAYRAQQQTARHAEVARAMRRLFEDSFDVLAVTHPSRSPLLSGQLLQAAEARLRDRSAGTVPEVQVYGLLALSKSHAAAGNYARAMALVEEARALSGGKADQAPLIGAAQAHLLNVQARYPEALRAAGRGLAAVDAMPAPDRDPTRLALEVEQARGLRSTGKVREGQAVLDRALARAEAMSARNPTPLAELLILRGEWAALFYRFEDAERDYRRAVALTERDDPVIADNARAALANNLSYQDQDDRALPIAREVLANRRRMFGERHPETGKAWILVATIVASSSSAKPDTAAAQRGEEILRAALGPDHPETARASQVVGWMQSRIDPKVMDEAIADARRALSIMQRSHGASTPQAIGAMVHLASMLASKGDARQGSDALWTEVISLYSRATAMGARQGMPMLWPRASLVRARLRAGQTGPELEAELKRVIAELTQARGRANGRVLRTRWILGELYFARKDFDAVRAVLHDLVRDTAGAGPGSEIEPLRMQYLGALGEGMKDKGDLESARSYLEQGQAISLRLNGPDSPQSKWYAEQLAGLDAPGGRAR